MPPQSTPKDARPSVFLFEREVAALLRISPITLGRSAGRTALTGSATGRSIGRGISRAVTAGSEHRQAAGTTAAATLTSHVQLPGSEQGASQHHARAWGVGRSGPSASGAKRSQSAPLPKRIH